MIAIEELESGTYSTAVTINYARNTVKPCHSRFCFEEGFSSMVRAVL